MIEKCSSPIGDGNSSLINSIQERLKQIEKCSSPIGDGNQFQLSLSGSHNNIEKCSSPIGDGNSRLLLHSYDLIPIEKCSSPIGDGNVSEQIVAHLFYCPLRNVAPR